MKRRIVFIIVGGFLLGLLGGGAYIYFSKRTAPPEITGPKESPALPPKQLFWDDPAGFTMQYPEGLMLDKHDEDMENYAHVEMTHNAHPGSLIVWVKDLPKGVSDTATWGKKASTPSSALSFNTTLGDQPAQKILIAQPAKTATVGVVWDGVLWYIEANLMDESYWQSVYDAVVNSFTFKPLPGETAGSGAGSTTADVVVDEEEILE